MTTVMKVLAKSGEWEMVQDVNSCISLHHGAAMFLVDSAIEGLRNIPDMEIRKLMAQQLFQGV